MDIDIEPRFELGNIVATPGALAALEDADISPAHYLSRHVKGDWEQMDPEDREANVFAIEHGLRILSAYVLPTGVKLWIITEADRSATTLLLPSEY